MAPENAPRPYPLYSTTFTTHRLSPLFHSNVTVDDTALRQYASQFRDVLTGEFLRGVRVGLGADDEILARVGALKTVRWNLLRNEEDWEPGADETQMNGDDTTIQERSHVGILAEIIYEKSTYSAILLHDAEKRGDEIAGFSHYPLLLTRMPGPLRETFLDFLAATFDTRASVLKLPSNFLAETAEKYLANITSTENGTLDTEPATRVLRTVIKDILITLSFDIPGMTSSLKTMDITISREDSWRMIQSGRKLLQVVDGQKDGNNAKVPRPFTRALKQHVDVHLSLKLDDPRVKISRVACGAFVLVLRARSSCLPRRPFRRRRRTKKSHEGTDCWTDRFGNRWQGRDHDGPHVKCYSVRRSWTTLICRVWSSRGSLKRFSIIIQALR